MRIYFILFSLLFQFYGFNQNYQTINSKQINYFADSNLEYILATRTDSIEINGLDSIFYSYKTLRQFYHPQLKDCDYIKWYPWYGKRVEIKPNGDNVFYNYLDSIITIKTQAILNDTFIVYNYPNGSLIKGIVELQDTMTVFGIIDSVKSIKLISDQIIFDFNEEYILLSKNYGFIKTIPFWSFPYAYSYRSKKDPLEFDKINTSMHLVGREFPRQGITKLTKGEIFNLKIGDLVRYHLDQNYENPGQEYYGTYTISEKTIIDRIQWGNDSLYLKYKIKEQRVNYRYPEPTVTHIGSNIYSQKIYNLNEYINPFLPEEYYDHSEKDNPDIEIFKNNLSMDNCDRIIEETSKYSLYNISNQNGNNVDSSICFINLEYFEVVTFNEGLGEYLTTTLGSYNGFIYTASGEISYYSQNGETCGDFWSLDIAVLKQAENLIIYPNPNKGQVTIDLRQFNNPILKVINLKGQLLFSDSKISTSNYNLNLNLEPGIYIVSIESDGQTFNKKMVIE